MIMKKATLLIGIFSFIATLSCCQKGEQFEIRQIDNLSYRDKEISPNDSLQMLNLVLPEKKGSFPLFIWIGGGAWSYGDRHQEMDLARQFARKGIAVASIGHRLSAATWRDPALNKGIQHPKHMEDVAASVKWLYDHAKQYGYDRNNMIIGGFSSGAHLAALMGLDHSYLEEVGLSPSIFKGMIPISGTYDIVDYHSVFLNGNRPELAELHVEAVFGHTKADWIKASPTQYLDNLSIPILLITDNALTNYTKLFEDQLRALPFNDVEVFYSHNYSHGELWKNISLSEKSIYRAAMIEFIKMQTAS